MSFQYFNLSVLATAAAACDCTAHLHLNDQGDTVFSVGSENIGAAEFDSYDDAMAWAAERAERDAGDRAEEDGAAIARDCLNEMLNADGQALRIRILQNAILEMGRLQHPKRAAGGFSVVMAPVIELGLAHAPRGELDILGEASMTLTATA